MSKQGTKALNLFCENFDETIRHINTWGIDQPFDAWAGICNRNEVYICKRTVNAILKNCDSFERSINWQIANGYELFEDEKVIRKALSVVRNTCNNWIKEEEAIRAL